jgi:hypothetical protein
MLKNIYQSSRNAINSAWSATARFVLRPTDPLVHPLLCDYFDASHTQKYCLQLVLHDPRRGALNTLAQDFMTPVGNLNIFGRQPAILFLAVAPRICRCICVCEHILAVYLRFPWAPTNGQNCSWAHKKNQRHATILTRIGSPLQICVAQRIWKDPRF